MKLLAILGLAAAFILLCGCPQPPSEVCGNGTCDAGEDATLCPADCSTGQNPNEIPLPPDPGSTETPPELPF